MLPSEYFPRCTHVFPHFISRWGSLPAGRRTINSVMDFDAPLDPSRSLLRLRVSLLSHVVLCSCSPFFPLPSHFSTTTPPPFLFSTPSPLLFHPSLTPFYPSSPPPFYPPPFHTPQTLQRTLLLPLFQFSSLPSPPSFPPSPFPSCHLFSLHTHCTD